MAIRAPDGAKKRNATLQTENNLHSQRADRRWKLRIELKGRRCVPAHLNSANLQSMENLHSMECKVAIKHLAKCTSTAIIGLDQCHSDQWGMLPAAARKKTNESINSVDKLNDY